MKLKSYDQGVITAIGRHNVPRGCLTTGHRVCSPTGVRRARSHLGLFPTTTAPLFGFLQTVMPAPSLSTFRTSKGHTVTVTEHAQYRGKSSQSSTKSESIALLTWQCCTSVEDEVAVPPTAKSAKKGKKGPAPQKDKGAGTATSKQSEVCRCGHCVEGC